VIKKRSEKETPKCKDTVSGADGPRVSGPKREAQRPGARGQRPEARRPEAISQKLEPEASKKHKKHQKKSKAENTRSQKLSTRHAHAPAARWRISEGFAPAAGPSSHQLTGER